MATPARGNIMLNVTDRAIPNMEAKMATLSLVSEVARQLGAVMVQLKCEGLLTAGAFGLINQLHELFSRPSFHVIGFSFA
jgi:hypothetical protein